MNPPELLADRLHIRHLRLREAALGLQTPGILPPKLNRPVAQAAQRVRSDCLDRHPPRRNRLGHPSHHLGQQQLNIRHAVRVPEGIAQQAMPGRQKPLAASPPEFRSVVSVKEAR